MRLSKAYIAWWDAQPEAQTCSDCGRAGRKAYVQPQRSGGALCTDCINSHNERAREKRKADLAAAPRCEVPGCKRRGAWRVGHGRVLLCGHHKSEARRTAAREMAGAGAFALFLPGPIYSRADVLRMAETKGVKR